jgi:hypothetical protein
MRGDFFTLAVIFAVFGAFFFIALDPKSAPQSPPQESTQLNQPWRGIPDQLKQVTAKLDEINASLEEFNAALKSLDEAIQP